MMRENILLTEVVAPVYCSGLQLHDLCVDIITSVDFSSSDISIVIYRMSIMICCN